MTIDSGLNTPAAASRMISGMSVRVRAPNEPITRMPRLTRCVMPIGAAVLPAAIPTPTMRPPSRTLSNA